MANLPPKSGSTKPTESENTSLNECIMQNNVLVDFGERTPFVQLWFATNGTNTNPTSGMTFLQSPETRFGPHVTRPRKFMRIIFLLHLVSFPCACSQVDFFKKIWMFCPRNYCSICLHPFTKCRHHRTNPGGFLRQRQSLARCLIVIYDTSPGLVA